MKILVITPYSRDASSFWRCMGPMSYLSRASHGAIDIYTTAPGMTLAWDTIGQYDLIYLHRPCRRDDIIVMQVAKNANIPVWVDYDDWLFHLPEWNPHKDAYHNPQLQMLMGHILACADVVTCTTDTLAKAFSKINDNVVICPNAYRSDIFDWRNKESLPERALNFFWRGTNTHDGDLLSVKEGLKGLPDKLTVFGSLPYALQNEMDPSQYNLIPHQDVLVYWQKLYLMAPKFLVFPLYDCFFNRCKSNIAWIEASHAGAMSIAPDLPEWRQPGVITYTPNDSESFKAAVNTAMSLTPAQHKEQAQLSYEHMRQKYDIKVVNEIRIKICEAVLSPSFKKNTKSPYDSTMGMWAISTLKEDKK